jgi:hypothetical protein
MTLITNKSIFTLFESVTQMDEIITFSFNIIIIIWTPDKL